MKTGGPDSAKPNFLLSSKVEERKPLLTVLKKIIFEKRTTDLVAQCVAILRQHFKKIVDLRQF